MNARLVKIDKWAGQQVYKDFPGIEYNKIQVSSPSYLGSVLVH